MLYTALGDSVTYGYSAESPNGSFVTRVQRSLSKQQPVHVYLQAKPGWTSKQLLKSLDDVQDCIWEESRLITIMIGGNDLLRASPWLLNGNSVQVLKVAEKLSENLEGIVERVSRPQSKVVVSTIYNPFPHSLIAQEYMNTINKAIHTVVHRHGAILADVYQHFLRKEQNYIHEYRRGQLRDFRLRGNPVHPNDSGHQAIAQVVLRAYRRAVASAKVQRQRSR